MQNLANMATDGPFPNFRPSSSRLVTFLKLPPDLGNLEEFRGANLLFLSGV